ncbi:aryl hydrocarbon receptor-like isoform X1 [Falco rusticolus]|uniref:aryl hydrocarbon receptor-like isoform X1 n=2 Tax=Falco rusticolus TaxID=120794 RepID=UPI0018868B38|nr:aryl hydrocarbon receptor-like isoform X1 [Falco rusticolus]
MFYGCGCTEVNAGFGKNLSDRPCLVKLSFASSSPKPPPPEGVKSNPSKRHRDRLNQELNKLMGLLPFPEDVRTRLDKLSILRLTVGYLKVKSYLMATATNTGDRMLDQPRGPGGNSWTDPQVDRELFPEGELLLQALNGFVIAVTGDGYIFYISPTVQDYLGFHQSDLIYQSVYELIHADDRAAFRHQLHRAPVPGSTQPADDDASPSEQPLLAGCSAVSSPQHLHPEKPSFVERSFTCRFRCLLDNSSGFLALNFRGRLKFLLGQQKSALDKSPLALFAVATLLQPLSILELRTKMLIFQTKHKLDFTPVACDSRGKVVLGYTETELCRRGSGYQFVHVADMMHCAENHVRMMKTGESGLTVFRLLTKKGGWVWVQANARLVYKAGKPDCIIARQRALSNEEGEEHLRKRNLQLPFSFATGEAVLYGNDLPEFLDSFQAKEELQTQANSHSKQRSVDPSSLLGAMMKQDASIYISHTDVPQFSLPDVIAEPTGLSQNEEAGDAREHSDSLLVVIETLFEKSKVNGNICQTLQSLNVDNAELQRWEEALLSLGAEEPPAQEGGERLATEVVPYEEQMLLSEDAGKSMDFPHCSASLCDEENSAAAHFQHCRAMNSAFQGPPQPQAPGAQGQDAVVSLVSITSEVSTAQPEQQVPFHSARLMGGTVLDVLVSSGKSSVALQLANPGQVLQAEVATSAPVDNTIPNDQSQPGCKLVGSSCPPPLHSNTLVTQWHSVLVQANPANALGQSASPGCCPPEAWMAVAPKQLEVSGTHMGSQTLLAGSPESSLGAGLWLLPSQPAPCPAQGLHESLFSGAGDLCDEEAVLPARASAPLGVSQLSGDGGIPKQPLIPHLEPSISWAGEQAALREDKWVTQRQPWLLQAGAAPQRCSRAGSVQHSGLLLGSNTGPSTHQLDHIVLPECQYRSSLFESSFLRDAAKISLPQQLGALPCLSESHRGASCSSPGSVLRCPAALPAKVGAEALPSSERGPGFPSASFAGGQPRCACEVQPKVRCEGCRT